MKQVEYYKNGNRTLRIKYEGIKKLLEKKDKEIERLHSIIKEVREYIEKHKNMTQGSFNGKEWVEQYFELVCDPKELLEILDKGSNSNE